jgi:hypothetical protein
VEHTINDFPIYMGTTDQKRSEDLSTDMIFSRCEKCNLIQLSDLIPLDILYRDSHNRPIGGTWIDHHKKFADFVLKFSKPNIIEIGGAHLMLARHLEKDPRVESITVYDTNITDEVEESSKIRTENNFFDPKSVKIKPDIIIHSHVLEHLYDPVSQIDEMVELLDSNGLMLISAPIIDVMMRDGFTNAMNFEHSYGLTKNLIYKILSKAGLTILEEEDFSEHCVFIAAAKKEPSGKNFKETEDCSYFYDFISYYEEEVDRVIPLLGKKEDTFIFGAHIFTQFLLKFGLSEESFMKVLDNDDKKQGQRLYGTNMMVESPKILEKIESPIVLLKAGQYTEEIKKDILENINANTRFIL